MAIASDLIISSDSHVMEPVDLWKKASQKNIARLRLYFRRIRSARAFNSTPAAGTRTPE
jgi:hypothetical protein